MPLDLAALGIERNHRAGVEIVARPYRRVERARIADAPVDRVQLGIERAGDPGRAAAELPGVALPGFVAGLAGSRNRIGAPQMLAGLRIPAVDEVAGAELGAGNTGDHHTVGDQRRDRHRIAGLEIDGILAPQLLAGLRIERDDIGVERGAEDLAVVDRGAAIDDAAAHDARRFRRILNLGFPDLLAGLGVDRHRGAVGGDVKNAFVDQWLGFFAAIVVEAVIPDRNETFDRIFVDLLKRRETLQIVAHPVVENIVGVGRALHQLIVRLCHRSWRKKHRQPEGPCEGLHGRPPLEHASFATAIAVRDVSLPYLL